MHEPSFRDIAVRTKGIAFLGTPHRGSTFARLGSILALVLRPLRSNEYILEEIRYDSLQLQDLHEQFTDAMGLDIEVYNFFEERATCLVKLGICLWSELVSLRESSHEG